MVLLSGRVAAWRLRLPLATAKGIASMTADFRNGRSGFVFFEALMVLATMLALLGLGIALAVRICVGPLPWHVWAGSGLAFPLLTILILRLRDFPRIPPRSRAKK